MTKSFKVNISEEILQNIYSKVKNYQWHEMPDDGGWDYGTNLEYMKEFSKFWIDKYDWRRTEEKISCITRCLGTLPKYKTNVRN